MADEQRRDLAALQGTATVPAPTPGLDDATKCRPRSSIGNDRDPTRDPPSDEVLPIRVHAFANDQSVVDIVAGRLQLPGGPQQEAESDVPDNGETMTRQTLTAATFVEIADTLVGEFDVIDVLTLLTTRCVELLDAAAAGILLADGDGHLRVIGASNEQTRLLELFQIQNEEGPCLDCVNTGEVVYHSDLDTTSPWPRFAAECTAAGYSSVCAVPLRLKPRTLGCLNLFMSGPGGLTDSDVALAQALADVASITIVQDEVARDGEVREGQLLHALTSRVPIEQAKGMIAEHDGVDMDAAFSRLRAFARNHNRRLTEVAESLVAGTIDINTIRAGRRPPIPPPPSRP